MLARLQRPLRGESGITFIEVMAAIVILVIVASAAVPLYHWNEKRRKEKQLRIALTMMRTAIDQYKSYVDQGLIIQEDVDQMGYPLTLEDLVEGVDVGDPDSPDRSKLQFLALIPEDPFTGFPDWGLRSYQDDWDSDSWGGENVYDVYSLYEGIALDGTLYTEW